MSEGNPEKVNTTNSSAISRRTFLRKAGEYAAAGVAIAAGLPLDSSPKTVRPINEKVAIRKPEQFSDLLTEVDLNKYKITINQTESTRLHLRKEVLQLPIFRDIEEGRLNGVVINLVDTESLTWKSTDKLPEDARSVWQILDPHPSQLTDQQLQNKCETEQVFKALRQDRVDQAKEQLVNKSLSSQQKEEIIAELERAQEKLNATNNLLPYNRQNAIHFFTEYGISQGAYRKLTKEWLQTELDKYLRQYPDNYENALSFVDQHPEWANKVYIYLCVGGSYSPSPDQSYPSDLTYSAGGIIRHEFGHHLAGNKEDLADKLALESIEEAWEKYRETGNSSGFPFVFVNKKGITVTQYNEAPKSIA